MKRQVDACMDCPLLRFILMAITSISTRKPGLASEAMPTTERAGSSAGYPEELGVPP